MDEVEFLVENIVFQSNDGAFCVFRAKSKENGSVSVVYRGVAPFVGELVKMQGKWGQHPKFGRQFQAATWQAVKPSTKVGIERFLGSGAIRGVGKAMAARIIERFGEDALEIISKDPYRLTEVVGIGKKKAEDILTSYAELNDMRELMVYLEAHGISSNYAPKLQAVYGATAITRIENNPYCLATDIDGIGFKTADKIALALGHDFNDDERIKAGVKYALLQAASQGHTCVPDNMLVNVTAGLLQIDEVVVLGGFNQLIKDDLLRTEAVGGVRLVYPEHLYKAETGVAHRLLALRDNVNKLWKVDYQAIIKTWEEQEHIELAQEQKDAVKASVEHGVFVLTGGPGTGKTTVVKGILSVLEKAGCKILLAAPTGRAARRLSESAGQSAATVHRLLEYTPAGGEQFWGKNSDNPLEADAIIIDEASMLDISLMYYLLRAIPIGCRLILVGDVDQLPSVGPGSVLKDIIRSKAMPVVRLENIFRQAQLSPIVRNAHRINRGLQPEFEAGSDFSFQEFEHEEDAAKFIVNIYAKLTDNGKWQDVQVLSPMHKNPCGVQNLNVLLQRRINPPTPTKSEINTGGNILRVGDKIMQIRNNYEKDVFNGDIGIVKSISGRNIVAAFPDRAEGEDVAYSAAELDDLQLAYAMSVHKSQGSEYGTVIMPFVRSHYMLLQKNLLYTGVTRAKGKVILVGSSAAINIAVNNDKTRKRYSLLAERLQDVQNLN